MKPRVAWQNLRDTFWFLPAVLVLVSLCLAFALVAAHGVVAEETLGRWPRLFGAGADGARGLLATVASSMITVAGVVFSITIVALSLASNQYTSRVLRSFMGDRVNQAVLGVFVGIFVYCLVVLRTIRGGDEGSFVPSLAVLCGLLLALIGVATLIYFIHHISVSIQAAHILANVAAETLVSANLAFPAGVREAGGTIHGDDLRWHTVQARRTGYLQSVDVRGLVNFASERGTVLRLERAVGQFVIEGTPVVAMRDGAPGREDSARLCAMLVIDRQRVIDHDPAFGIRLIVDIALRALSPGINDTTTAVMAIDYLTAILLPLGERAIPSSHTDEAGEIRVLNCGPSYASLVDDAFDQIRASGNGNFAIVEALLAALGTLAKGPCSAPHRAVLTEQARALAQASEHGLEAPRERARVAARAAQVMALLESGPRVGRSDGMRGG